MTLTMTLAYSDGAAAAVVPFDETEAEAEEALRLLAPLLRLEEAF